MIRYHAQAHRRHSSSQAITAPPPWSRGGLVGGGQPEDTLPSGPKCEDCDAPIYFLKGGWHHADFLSICPAALPTILGKTRKDSK